MPLFALTLVVLILTGAGNAPLPIAYGVHETPHPTREACEAQGAQDAPKVLEAYNAQLAPNEVTVEVRCNPIIENVPS